MSTYDDFLAETMDTRTILKALVTEEPCDMCQHSPHGDGECPESVGYDHMNGDHECGCPGSIQSRLADAWRQGAAMGHKSPLTWFALRQCNPFEGDAR